MKRSCWPGPGRFEGSGSRASDRSAEELAGDRLAQRILKLANQGLTRVEFLIRIARLLLEQTGSDALEIWLREDGSCARFRLDMSAELPAFELVPCHRLAGGGDAHELLCEVVRKVSAMSTGRTAMDGCFVRNSEPVPLLIDCAPGGMAQARSSALLPLSVGGEVIGWLLLMSAEAGHFPGPQLEPTVRMAETLGIALINQRAQAAQRERVKELTCLYKLSQLAEMPEISSEAILQGIADLLPPAWQYPEIVVGTILLDGRRYTSQPGATVIASQQARIVVDGVLRGHVEVGYTEERAQLDEGPFLTEERHLINAIAREIAVIIERREVALERATLLEQLLHSDRLATIGQLAAGVAHELNEPLGAVLGFAQLAKRSEGLGAGAAQDISKIEVAALHAREIVKKLMIFARQAPPRKELVDLNQVVESSLYFLESRCAKNRIEVTRRFADDLPDLTADASQLQQVLVNLVVNAIHAMEDGGCLTITTASGISEAGEEVVLLRVDDTGHGMSEEVAAQIFLPFFTTKDVNEGTGLGLAVVHGIVSSHGGTIRVHSSEGAGARFTIELPLGGPEDEEGR